MSYKRLTKKDEEYGNFVPNRGSELNNPKIAVSYNGKIHGTIIDCLADLEDKIERGELVENKVVTYINMARSNSKTLVDKALKYDELKAKIENGTLIELPCMVGDKVYMPRVYDGASAVAELTVKHIDLEEKIIATILESDVFGYLRKYDYGVFGFEDMGAVIFLTKSEAEAKLKELQGE